MEITQEQKDIVQKHVEQAIMNAAKEVDGLTVEYLPDLIRGQVGSKFLKLVSEVLTAIEKK
jgi:hypothetical protein